MTLLTTLLKLVKIIENIISVYEYSRRISCYVGGEGGRGGGSTRASKG